MGEADYSDDEFLSKEQGAPPNTPLTPLFNKSTPRRRVPFSPALVSVARSMTEKQIASVHDVLDAVFVEEEEQLEEYDSLDLRPPVFDSAYAKRPLEFLIRSVQCFKIHHVPLEHWHTYAFNAFERSDDAHIKQWAINSLRKWTTWDNIVSTILARFNVASTDWSTVQNLLKVTPRNGETIYAFLDRWLDASSLTPLSEDALYGRLVDALPKTGAQEPAFLALMAHSAQWAGFPLQSLISSAQMLYTTPLVIPKVQKLHSPADVRANQPHGNKKRKFNSNRSADASKNPANASKKPKYKCNHCGKDGHSDERCFQLHPELNIR